MTGDHHRHAAAGNPSFEHLDLAGLSKYDMPEYILPVDEMPLTASGKVLKRELVRSVEEGRLQPLLVRFHAAAKS